MGLYLILMGVQGAGKGVQATFIRKNYGDIPQISTGDLFRAMRTRQDDFAKQIQQLMAEGKLISDEITNKMVEERLALPDAANGVIFDGFPRTPAQADWLEQYLAKKGEKVVAVLLLELEFYEAFRRAFGRVTGKDNSSYNFYSNAEGIEWNWVEYDQNLFPPRLEATVIGTGEKLIRRADDANADAIIKRIDTFAKTTQPLIAYYRQKKLVHEIDASQSIEAVSAEIKAILDRAK